MGTKPKLLLHVCCAPCSTHPIRKLQEEYEVELFFYNPNIQPEEEYRARLEEAKRYAEKIGVKLHEASYEAENWCSAVRGLQDEPEGGWRCEICYRMRLGKTARFASANGFDKFATTLSVSPHKEAHTINTIGAMIADMYSLEFLEEDFKKKEGFRISVEMSKEAGLYRQDYCGCSYSRKETEKCQNQRS